MPSTVLKAFLYKLTATMSPILCLGLSEAQFIHLVHACYVTSVVSDSARRYGLQPARLLCPRDSPGKTTGAGCHALLQGIIPTQGSNLCLL